MGMAEMGRLCGVGLVALAVFACDAQATEPRIDCKNAMAQQDMNICADRDFQAADRALNAAYRKLTAGLDAHEKELLVAAQRAWIAFRDKECTYYASQSEGGSIYPLLYSGCLRELTNARTRQINDHIKDRSGN